MMKKIALLSFICFLQISLLAQTDTIAVKTIEGITNKMIELISGDIGEKRNWEAYRNLFLPSGQKLSIQIRPDGTRRARARNLEEFVREVGPFYKRDGFEEYAIGLTVNEFNGIANVFQSYYCKTLTGTYEARGINSYQLVYMDDRWWIANTMFIPETEGMPLPDKYLFKKYKSSKKD